MDNWIVVAGGLAVGATAFIYLRYGSKAGTVAGAAFALLLTYLAGRRGQRTEVENEVAREELKDEIERNEAIGRAARAGDAARDVPADRLRDADSFERR